MQRQRQHAAQLRAANHLEEVPVLRQTCIEEEAAWLGAWSIERDLSHVPSASTFHVMILSLFSATAFESSILIIVRLTFDAEGPDSDSMARSSSLRT